ncbi:hypothetical protein AAIG11_08900 [Anoxynatronum sibiricum]|uniref:Oligoendopeptidase F n=1 Tax=Anoxynatronum sibiricum TaxID=210623 RepID=A0ABU9VU30_9CLOT
MKIPRKWIVAVVLTLVMAMSPWVTAPLYVYAAPAVQNEPVAGYEPVHFNDMNYDYSQDLHTIEDVVAAFTALTSQNKATLKDDHLVRELFENLRIVEREYERVNQVSGIISYIDHTDESAKTVEQDSLEALQQIEEMWDDIHNWLVDTELSLLLEEFGVKAPEEQDLERRVFNQQVNDLLNQYNMALNADYSREFDGENYSIDELEGLYFSDENPEAGEVLLEAFRSKNAMTGPIFVDLVNIRNDYAKKQGYEHYLALLFDDGTKDFQVEDLLKVADYTKEHLLDFREVLLEAIYVENERLSQAEVPMPQGNYLEWAEQTVAGTFLEHAFRVLMEKELLIIPEVESGSYSAFVTVVLEYNTPLMVMRDTGDLFNDYNTFLHELGHFAEVLVVCEKRHNEAFPEGSKSLEIVETHSTSNQYIAASRFEDLFEDNANYFRLKTTFAAIDFFYILAPQTEFLFNVYTTEDLTLEKVNQISYQVRESYPFFLLMQGVEEDYYWVEMTQDFESPLYSTAYGVSSLASFDMFDETVPIEKRYEQFENLINHTRYGKFRESLITSGYTDIFAPEALEPQFQKMYDFYQTTLEKIEESKEKMEASAMSVEIHWESCPVDQGHCEYEMCADTGK